MRVNQLMTRMVQTCAANDDLNKAADIMWSNDCGCVPVVDAEHHVVGMITDRDVAMAAYTQGKPLASIPIHVAMARDVKWCKQDEDIAIAEGVMRANQIRRVPVVDDDGVLVGMLSLNDLARAAAEPQRVGSRFVEDLTRTIAAVCRPRENVAADPSSATATQRDADTRVAAQLH